MGLSLLGVTQVRAHVVRIQVEVLQSLQHCTRLPTHMIILFSLLQIDRVVEAVEETLKGHIVQLLSKKKLPRLDLPKARFAMRAICCCCRRCHHYC